MSALSGGQRALVFGAAGFIGRWVVQELQHRSVAVTGVVRAGAPLGAFSSWRSVPDLLTADLLVDGVAAGIVADVRPSVVFNLAGYGVDRTERDAPTAERLNHYLVAELAAACGGSADRPGPTLVHVGSALEYGTAKGVLSEHTPPSPTTLYGRTKLAGTIAVGEAARTRGTRGLTARLFTVFGDGEHAGRLFPSLIAAARSGAALPLTDGTQLRDFAWAGDVAALLVDLAAAPFRAGEIVNVASGRLHTVAAFVRECASRLGMTEQQLQFGALPSRPDEMSHAGVDVRRLVSLVGRAPNADLGDAIRHSLATPAGGGR